MMKSLVNKSLGVGNNCTLLSLLSGIWLILFNYCLHIDAFNLENRLPIVKYGEDGTYFGYSVASHITVAETDDKDKTQNVKW